MLTLGDFIVLDFEGDKVNEPLAWILPDGSTV